LTSSWRALVAGDQIERGTLDISADGEDVVVGGSGEAVSFYGGCTSRTLSAEIATWTNFPIPMMIILTVDLSPDGRYVVAGGKNISSSPYRGRVVFYKDAKFSNHTLAWYAYSRIDIDVVEAKVSDDGYSVAAVTQPNLPFTLYYWANAKALSGDPDTKWNSTFPYSSVDLSSDGNEVAAGKPLAFPCGLRFWSNARGQSGPNVPENWKRHEGEYITDVAINADGTIIAAAAEAATGFWAYFYTSDGLSLGEFKLLQFSDKVSMSADGRTIAIGGAPDHLHADSLYLFKIPTPVGGEIISTQIPSVETAIVVVIVTLLATIGIQFIRKRQEP